MKSLIRRWDLMVAGVLAAAGLVVYVAHPARVKELRESRDGFYRPLVRDGISFDGSAVVRALDSGEFTPWTHLLARTLLVRARRKGLDPEAVERLLARWQEGLWSPPDPVQVVEALERFDAQWIERRRRCASDPQSKPVPGEDWTIRALALEEGSVSTSFLIEYDSLDPARIGSAFILESPLSTPPTIYWATTVLGISGERVQRPVRFEQIDGGRTRATYDFSAEPGWLAPGARLALMRIHGDANPDAQPGIRIGGTDGQ